MTQPIEEPKAGPSGATDDLSGQTVRGVGWTAAAQVGRQGLQLVFSIVVARLLLPEDFGQVAQVVVLAGLANVISDFGFGAALVQRAAIDERHRSSVFWVQGGLGLLVTLAIAGSSPIIARFYGEPDLRAVAVVLAPNFFLSSMCTVQRALLTRELRFKALAIVDVSAIAASGIVCVVAASMGAGVFSIVAQTLTSTAITLILLWSAASWRPHVTFDRAALGELVPFSRNLFGYTVINYAMRNSDNLLVGRLMGATALGLYSRGYSILLYPTRQISSVIGKVMFASLSRLSDDVDRLRRAYLRAVAVIALITFPLMIGLALVTEEFVLGLLGERWSAAITVIRIFCLVGAIESVFTTVGWIYQSTGRTDVLFRLGLVLGVLPLAGIAVGAALGSIETVTAAYAVSTTLLIYPVFRSAGRLIDMRFSEVVAAVRGVALCTAVMAGVVATVGWLMPPDLHPLISLAAQGAVGAITYAATVHITRVDAYLDLRRAITTQLQRRRVHP